MSESSTKSVDEGLTVEVGEPAVKVIKARTTFTVETLIPTESLVDLVAAAGIQEVRSSRLISSGARLRAVLVGVVALVLALGKLVPTVGNALHQFARFLLP